MKIPRLLLLLPALTVLAACEPQPEVPTPPEAAAGAAAEITVYKSPTCGCCGRWAEHLAEAGFAVRQVEVDDLHAVKLRNDIPPGLGSCHTAEVAGYAIEGHVPAAEIHRLLAERPAVAGLTVPAMPIGSPGMEQGERTDRYVVQAFDAEGNSAPYAHYEGSRRLAAGGPDHD